MRVVQTVPLQIPSTRGNESANGEKIIPIHIPRHFSQQLEVKLSRTADILFAGESA